MNDKSELQIKMAYVHTIDAMSGIAFESKTMTVEDLELILEALKLFHNHILNIYDNTLES